MLSWPPSVVVKGAYSKHICRLIPDMRANPEDKNLVSVGQQREQHSPLFTEEKNGCLPSSTVLNINGLSSGSSQTSKWTAACTLSNAMVSPLRQLKWAKYSNLYGSSPSRTSLLYTLCVALIRLGALLCLLAFNKRDRYSWACS